MRSCKLLKYMGIDGFDFQICASQVRQRSPRGALLSEHIDTKMVPSGFAGGLNEIPGQ